MLWQKRRDQVRNGLLFLSSQNIVLGVCGWRREEISIECHLLVSCLVSDGFPVKGTVWTSGIRGSMAITRSSQARNLSSGVI